MSELISVVITTYNRTQTLKRAIESVIAQTHRNIEILIIDDNIDFHIRKEVRKIVDSFNDSRIRLICNPENIGGALSRNVGIDAAGGKYVSFLDDDDEYLPNKIEKQYQLFRNSNDSKLSLVYCYCKEVGNKQVLYHYDYIGNCLYEAMIDCFAATSQWMCRKDLLNSVGNFSNVPCKQDSTVIVKLLAAGYTVDRVPEYLSIYHTEELNRISTSNHQKRIVGEEKLRELCRQHYDKISASQIEEVEYSFYTRLVEHYYALGMKDEFKNALKVLIKHPFRRKTLAAVKHMYVNKTTDAL